MQGQWGELVTKKTSKHEKTAAELPEFKEKVTERNSKPGIDEKIAWGASL